MLAPLSLTPSFGFGDRLGLATPGHIAAVEEIYLAPVFAQQSIRENARTGRTPRQVLDDAARAVEACDWGLPWGADADHLKSLGDLEPFVAAGYTFFTVDPSEQIDHEADALPENALADRLESLPWDALQTTPADLRQRYEVPVALQGLQLAFDEAGLLRTALKYGRAIAHVKRFYARLVQLKGHVFDFEVSIDETERPTSAEEHFFVASELRRLGVRFTSLAPHFVGRFEKGMDYLGDLQTLEADLARHAAVQRAIGDYKLSLHSGSDKLSVYPILKRLTGGLLHVKTAGTSYLEALRLVAEIDPYLFRKVLDLARFNYEDERRTYHVSAEADLPALLDDFHARQVLHVTFGTVLEYFGPDLRQLLIANQMLYTAALKSHFRRHLELLTL
jgi:hypothetical protein